MGVYEKARELVEMLKQEEVYEEFIERQQQIFAVPVLKELLMDLRRREFAIYRHQLLGKEVDLAEEETLRELHEAACQENALKLYLEAEYRFSKMMLDIQSIINAAVPVKRVEN